MKRVLITGAAGFVGKHLFGWRARSSPFDALGDLLNEWRDRIGKG